MCRILLLIVLAACGRPADEDCWRGPVPVVRDCDCVSARGRPPSVASGDTSPNRGGGFTTLNRAMVAASPTATSSDLGTNILPPLLGEVSGGERSELEGDGGTTPCRALSLRITRLMIDPTDVPDRDGEWVEIHNPTPLPADISGVEIAVNGTIRCDLSQIIIPAFGYLLVARSGAPDRFPCPRLSLPNKRGEIALVRYGEVLDVVVWEKAPKGTSLNASQRPRRSSSPPPW